MTVEQLIEAEGPECFKCGEPITEFSDVRIVTVRADGKPMDVWVHADHAKPGQYPQPWAGSAYLETKLNIERRDMNKHDPEHVRKSYIRWERDYLVRYDIYRECFVRDAGPLDLEKEIR